MRVAIYCLFPMSTLPADVWALVFANITEHRPDDCERRLLNAMATLTISLALVSSHDVKRDAPVASLVAEKRAKAEAELVKVGAVKSEWIVSWHDMYHCSKWPIIRRGEVEEIVTRLAYRGVTGRFYWRVGMEAPEILLCKYAVKDIQRDIIVRCEEDMLETVVDRDTARRQADWEFPLSSEEDEDEIDDDGDEDDNAFQGTLDCITEIVEQHYPFDPAKIPHRLKSHMKEVGVDFETVVRCQYPECPLCKEATRARGRQRDAPDSMNAV